MMKPNRVKFLMGKLSQEDLFDTACELFEVIEKLGDSLGVAEFGELDIIDQAKLREAFLDGAAIFYRVSTPPSLEAVQAALKELHQGLSPEQEAREEYLEDMAAEAEEMGLYSDYDI